MGPCTEWHDTDVPVLANPLRGRLQLGFERMENDPEAAVARGTFRLDSRTVALLTLQLIIVLANK